MRESTPQIRTGRRALLLALLNLVVLFNRGPEREVGADHEGEVRVQCERSGGDWRRRELQTKGISTLHIQKKLFLSDMTINCKGYGQSITTAKSSYAPHQPIVERALYEAQQTFLYPYSGFHHYHTCL
jgi:hypothetical protein